MNAPTEYQTIFHDGRPAYVLVPVVDWERIKPLLSAARAADGIPQAVVEAHVLGDVPLIRAWREHLGLTQQAVADAAGMAQPALARLERGEGNPRPATLARLAAAMGINAAQFAEERE
ncbi:helix-turn-helix domain-containing protein [Thiohalocapsa sp. ML1]|uniref:helix-turn-helix domain-containing protein n=1 Tax=Thiohalocapsa sp. ML1 TaxID=1431688 RepID=UPI0007323B7A|nr:helix-turn-helix transcriptional regulator [Thiohalocapsa sp. ML1]